MMAGFHRLRLVWLALLGLGWITTLSFGAGFNGVSLLHCTYFLCYVGL